MRRSRSSTPDLPSRPPRRTEVAQPQRQAKDPSLGLALGGLVALVWGMEKNRISSLAPRLSSAPDVVDLVDVEPTPHNPLLPTRLSGEGDNGASNALAGTPGQLFRPEAIEAMADELCRLAKEFKQRVGAQRLLPALGSLSAMGPLHGLLRKQLGSRLMVESVAVVAPDEEGEAGEPGDLPGYL